MLQARSTPFSQRHLQTHVGSEQGESSAPCCSSRGNKVDQNASCCKPGQRSLRLTENITRGSFWKPIALFNNRSSALRDTSEAVVLTEVQCFIVLSPSGSAFILLQDYSDSSMQICFY